MLAFYGYVAEVMSGFGEEFSYVILIEVMSLLVELSASISVSLMAYVDREFTVAERRFISMTKAQPFVFFSTPPNTNFFPIVPLWAVMIA